MLREKLLRLCFQLYFALEGCQFAFQTSSSESWELINVLQHLAIRCQAARVQYNTQSRVPRLSIYSPESVRHLPRASGTSRLLSRETCLHETSNKGCRRLALHSQRVGVSISSGSRAHTSGVQASVKCSLKEQSKVTNFILTPWAAACGLLYVLIQVVEQRNGKTPSKLILVRIQMSVVFYLLGPCPPPSLQAEAWWVAVPHPC